MSLSGGGKLAGVIGWPVAHSLSPRLHGYWLAELGIDGVLVPLPVRPEDLSLVVRALMLAGFKGANVTLPHKEAAFALCHDSDLVARATGAVNLLVFHDNGRIEGRNTDAGGLATSLRESAGAKAAQGKSAIVLGAGGAARAAVLALQDLGASEIRIVNRTRSRADTLAAALSPYLSSRLVVADNWPKAAASAALVVNTTSAGMTGSSPLTLDLAPLPKSAVICDIVYNPLETALLKRARAAGFATVDGLGMLMHQAVPAFAAFYGVEPKVTPVLRRHLEEALANGK